MMHQSFKIRQRINGYNYYALIELEVDENFDKELIIEYDDSRVDPKWKSSIDFGIKYFHFHYLENENKGFAVLVRNLHTMIGDSTPSIVFYITVKCLTELFSFKKDLVKINQETGEFIFFR
ncbi:hypothetical protein [Niastella populi]|uniref:Uncharacterized protein n=1 Tax=Niastella populi TaxID=550983 RepID=A0A1V9FI24_9BACT|nr:hypothetical protein [Niastella populi]OQP58028.1 hypothetical protein A4R26_23300 [Niastella populi]